MYCIDTNIFIDILRGKFSSVYDLMKQSDADLFIVPSVVEAELLLGARKTKEPAIERIRVESLLQPFEIVPFDRSCAEWYASIRAELEAQGKPIGGNDYLIAATALAHSAVLVTNNVKEFQRVPGLSVECWAEVDLWIFEN